MRDMTRRHRRPTVFWRRMLLTVALIMQPAGMVLLVTACGSQTREPNLRLAPPPQQQSMTTDLPADAQIRRHESNGTIVSLQAPNLSASLESDAEFRALQSTGRFADIALAFLAAHGPLFRIDQPTKEWQVTSTRTDELGLTHVRLQQTYAGLPVQGAELLVHLDQAAHVTSVQGRYIPTPSHLSPSPGLTAAQAEQHAARHLGTPRCDNCRSALVILARVDKPPRLAYRVAVTVHVAEGWEVFLDAGTGDLLEKRPTVFNSRP